MLTQLVLATGAIVVLAWFLPVWITRAVNLPAGALGIIATMALIGAAALVMAVMDLYGFPLRFADPGQEGAFLFSTVALAIPGWVVMTARIAKLTGGTK